MTRRPAFQPARLPRGSAPDPALTLVELTWREGRVEHWIRFGRTAYAHALDRHRRLVGFAPGAVFAFVRWASNGFGTVVSRLDIVRAVASAESFQTLPFVRPGGEILLRVDGWPKVERVLEIIDAIEAQAIDPGEVSPDYWRHVHNRLAVGGQPARYTRARHDAWLRRRELRP